jgi:hypothetical protein
MESRRNLQRSPCRGVIVTGRFSKSMNELRWTKSEKIIAKRAFDKCYQKKCKALLTRLKEKIASADKPLRPLVDS